MRGEGHPGRLTMGDLGSLGLVLLCLASQGGAEFEGLGDQFQPIVKASCVGGTMTVRVDTKDPYFGSVHSEGRQEAECSVQGRGGLSTVLSLPSGQCGLTYDEESGESQVSLRVAAHPSLSLLEDRLFSVSCPSSGSQGGSSKVTLAQLAVTDGNKKLDAVLESNSYALRASVTDPDPSKGLLIKNCRVFDGLGTSIQLVDDRSCRKEKLISEFTYRDSVGIAEATIYSMVRMSESARSYFQCDVEICSGPCPKPVCGGLYTGDSAAGLQSVSEDTVTTSTSVYVADQDSEAAVSIPSCSDDGGDINPAWLSGITIAFGVLFAVMLCINIFLCSAMTCSCTRTEVIEKEPSIYDDYSVYAESQYGYGGKHGPYSESDLGSEYGDMTGTLRGGSDAGTLTSRNSHSQPAVGSTR